MRSYGYLPAYAEAFQLQYQKYWWFRLWLRWPGIFHQDSVEERWVIRDDSVSLSPLHTAILPAAGLSSHQLPAKPSNGQQPSGHPGSEQSTTSKDLTGSLPYICNTEDEFSSSVQRIFFFPTFHTKNVHFPHVRSGGQILGVGGEGQRPGVHCKGSKGECLLRRNSTRVSQTTVSSNASL